MKKLLFLMLGITTLITTPITIIACNNDNFLEITNDDIRDWNGIPGNKNKIDTLAFFLFMNYLKKKKQDIQYQILNHNENEI